MDDGRLGFLDFGCFRHFSEKRWQFQRESEEAMFCNDQDKILQFITKVSFHDHPDEIDKNWAELMLKQVDWVVRPITTSGPFDFADKPYVDEGVALFKELIHHGYSRTDSFYNWTNRSLLGHRSLMYRLRCNFDYGSMYLHEAKLAAQRSPRL
jgi:hypothetical protein